MIVFRLLIFFSLFLSLFGSSMEFFVSAKTEMPPNDFKVWPEYLDQIQVCHTEFFEHRTTYGNNIARVFTVSIQTVTFLRRSYMFFYFLWNKWMRRNPQNEIEKKRDKITKWKKETTKHQPQNRTNEWDAKTVMQTTKYQINNLFFETFLFLL